MRTGSKDSDYLRRADEQIFRHFDSKLNSQLIELGMRAMPHADRKYCLVLRHID